MENWKLGKKIGFGFAVVLFLTIVVGIAGFVALSKVLGATDIYRQVSSVQSKFTQVKERTDLYFLNNYNEGREIQAEVMKTALAELEGCVLAVSNLSRHSELPQEAIMEIEAGMSEISLFKSNFIKFTEAEAEKIKLAETITSGLAASIELFKCFD